VSLDVSQPQHSILIVDDDAIIRKLVSIALSRAGYDVTIATDGHEALQRLSEATPDLIISDVMMPGLDGFALLTQLRTDPVLGRIPVIMLTARGTAEDVEQGLGLGADDYLPKPFEMRELVARARAKIERPPVPSELLTHDRQTGLLTERMFLQELTRELTRASRGGSAGALAILSLDELPSLREQHGLRAEAEIARQISMLLTSMRSLDIVGRDREGRFMLLMPEIAPEMAKRRLTRLAHQIVGHTFAAGSERVRVTPIIGFAPFEKALAPADLVDRALVALDIADLHLDLQPVAYEPSMDAAVAERRAARQAVRQRRWHGRLLRRLRLPFQIALTFVISMVLPFFIYVALYQAGLDIIPVMYLVVVVALFVTGYLIWIEGLEALKVIDPPEPSAPYPTATAIIAAYLPNEASTVVETIVAFLRMDYAGPLQIILAYNTPRDLPIEAVLQDMARRDTRFVPFRVMNSTSKAQNVNAALAIARGDVIGVFDADHQPQPDSFTRAWRWLSNGYDVVQGHCLVRNGEESWVARLIAVEFEAIYAVAHPGRARLHDFGVFGGSNGYWKADLLRETRMHGFMLTEDIDSSMRVIERGLRIISDPHLVSRELGPVTLKALWHQRMRWAQGWFQVSVKHLPQALRSKQLSLRQKLGFVHLLGWREIYPWLSPQMFPIIAFWIWRGHVLNWFLPIFVLTTVFTLSVGPGQTLFTYILSAPEIRRRKRWFVFYLIMTSLFYTEFKNLIARVAVIKELMHERAWKVTPRSAAPTPAQQSEA
jgi:DNA-binding response OmpR family regulator/cellulose synthase/poly-beta-1,6-N-acetylglucosamine synthase-like glycosyltransferase